VKYVISQGQIFLDAVGGEVEVMNVSRNGVTLKLAEGELVVAPMDEVLQDIVSGELVDSEEE